MYSYLRDMTLDNSGRYLHMSRWRPAWRRRDLDKTFLVFASFFFSEDLFRSDGQILDSNSRSIEDGIDDGWRSGFRYGQI